MSRSGWIRLPALGSRVKPFALLLALSINWTGWNDAVFAQAKREHKFVLLDLQAVWCHWCHVMDEQTYADPKVIALMKERAHTGRLRLSVDVDPALPAIFADAMRLKQILLNLLSNSVKFTEPGGSVVITVRQPGPDEIAFAVRDTGVGMSEGEIKIALEPFGQVDAGFSRNHEGTGLGLPLASRLAELHGGSLDIESRKGHGTTATVRLPVKRTPVNSSTAGPVRWLARRAVCSTCSKPGR